MIRQYLCGTFLLMFLGGCGGIQQQATGIEDSTILTVYADMLVGARLQINDQTPITIDDKDLLDYELGVLGAKDSKRERLDAYRVSLNAGSYDLALTLASGERHRKQMYFSTGQHREWFIE